MSENTGRVIKRTKGFYYLKTDSEKEVECKVKGQLFKNSRYDNQIAVGDIVRYIRESKDPVGLITGIEARKSFLSRNRVGKEAEQVIAANIDYLLIVSSTTKPAFRQNLVNRMLVAASVGNITPLIVVTKTDLTTDSKTIDLIAPYQNTGIDVILSSTHKGERNEKLYDILTNNICLLAGQSGVGKTSLLNMYFPGLQLKVGRISEKTKKGVHTTTYAKMIQIAPNGFVIDTPGVREFGLWNIRHHDLDSHYPLIRRIKHLCKHRDCNHIHEPQCAVQESVSKGDIHRSLYDGYITIFKSLNC